MQCEKEFIFYILVVHVMQYAKKAKRNDGRKNSLTQSTTRSTWLRVTHARNRAAWTYAERNSSTGWPLKTIEMASNSQLFESGTIF